LTFKLAQWYAFIFSSVFLLYGGVNIILAIMDHNYIDIAPPIIFVAIGLALMIPAIAYKELKIWGYYGLAGINGIVIILTLFGIGDWRNIILLVLATAAMGALFAPTTRRYLFDQD